MKISTPIELQDMIYLAFDTKAKPGEERFGIGIGRLYLGYYGSRDRLQRALGWFDKNIVPSGWAAGIVNDKGTLDN